MELIINFTETEWQCAVSENGRLVRYFKIDPVLHIGDEITGRIIKKSPLPASFFFEYMKGETGLLIKAKHCNVGDKIRARMIKHKDGIFKSAKFIPVIDDHRSSELFTVEKHNPFTNLISKHGITKIICNPSPAVNLLPMVPQLCSIPFDEVLKEEIAELNNPVVALSDGSRIIIEKTAAFTTIDVDSGSSCAQADIINAHAAHEIIRQIVLRDIYGIIVIDFIGHSFHKNLKNAVELIRNNRDSIKLISVTRLNLVELIRERQHE